MRPPSLLFVLLFVAAILGFFMLSLAEQWYLKFDWIDIPFHLLGGAWVAFVFFYIQHRYAPTVPTIVPWWMDMLFAVSFVMLVGVMWEWFEFGFDFFFPQGQVSLRAQLGLPDTMGDLLVDIVGGALVAFSFLFKKISKLK